ncbi:MAG: leucine-rich repeat protein [Clostridia bacterium]|nr:leucine-rich repeat protein [Clostridia bacterium]
MKKLISILLTLAMVMTLLTIPVSAAVNVKITEGYSTPTENGGLYGKAADEYAVKWTTPDTDTKKPIKVTGSTYDFSGSTYVVLDLNVAPLEGATHFSCGQNAGIFAIDTVRAFNVGQWNSVRIVVEEANAEEMTARGTYQNMTMYVNGVKIETRAEAINSGDELYPNGTGTQKYGMGFRFSVHGAKSTDVAYVADVKVTESNENVTPVIPTLDASSKYDVYNYGIIVDGTATVGDLSSGNNSIRVYNGEEQITDADAVLSEGYTVVVEDTVNKLYKYYGVGTAPEVKNWTDDDGNTYTWSFSPYTKILTIGMVDYPTVAGGTYGALNTGNYASNMGGLSSRPWHSVSTEVKEICFDPDYMYKGSDGKDKTGYLTQIGREMFSSFTSLEEVTIPARVTSAQWGAFGYCTALHTVTFEEGSQGLGNTGMKMFQGCTSLRNVNFSSGTTAIGNNLFYGCTALSEVFIPAPVNIIAAHAFEGSKGLTIKSYESSTAASKIASTTFTFTGTAAAAKLKKVYLSTEGYLPDYQGNANSIKWVVDTTNKVLTISDVAEVGTGDMPEKAGDNYQGQFPWNSISGYTNVVFEDGITKIGRWALQGSVNTLENVTVPGTVKAGSVYAFNDIVVTNLIFEEGCTGIFSIGQVVNRSSKITNTYLPSTASDFDLNWWRGLDESYEDIYNGLSEINLYATGSEAIRWANGRAANPADDTDQSGKAVKINVIPTYTDDYTVSAITSTGVTVHNNTAASKDAYIIVAYFEGNTFKNVTLTKASMTAAGDATLVAASVAGQKRVVYVWEDMTDIKPLLINVSE